MTDLLCSLINLLMSAVTVSGDELAWFVMRGDMTGLLYDVPVE